MEVANHAIDWYVSILALSEKLDSGSESLIETLQNGPVLTKMQYH